ncbi:MAG: O-antigen ligase domain-containing protein [Pseudonocardiaceae bacterium]|nr:O-antigen ligase domain-containing protein [Pseudonocardiaceae bacterium]
MARSPASGSVSGGADVAPGTPRLVGVVWALLALNTLGYTSVDLIFPLPRQLAQMITMGALVVAFGLALALNPRVRVRPSAYLLLLSLLVVVSLASSMQLESGLGSLFRCFRLTAFVATLWLISSWWRGDLRFARYHLYTLGAVLLTVAAGLVISPGSALSGPDGRLVGAIWPIWPTQVGQYGAVATGLAIVLWLTRSIDGRSAAVIAVPAVSLLLLSHTRTALAGLIAGLAVAGLSLAFANARARRAVAAAALGAVVVAAFGHVVREWLRRGQDAEALSNLTGRQKVWNLLLAEERTVGEQVLGVGLTDKSFAGLPIDSSWLAAYHEQGWVGIAIVVAMLGSLIITAALRPPSPERACAIFLVLYCVVASYTEVGLGDASLYLLHLAVAASLLVRGDAEHEQATTPPRWSPG